MTSMTSTLPVETLRSVADELKPRVLGQLLLPDAPGFDEARSVWNAMIDRRPGLILRCLGVADVVAGVNAARTCASRAAVTTSPGWRCATAACCSTCR